MRNEKFLRDFDWNLLMTFLVIAEEGSITAASQRLFKTQPSISNALTRLERTVGHRLIDRRRGLFKLTDHGRLIHEKALQICRSVEGIGDLRGDEEKLTGQISYQIASHMVCPILDRVLAEYSRAQPAVTIFAEAVPSGKMVGNIMEGAASIGFCVLRAEVAGLKCRYLNANEMGFFCAPTHPLFGKTGLVLKDLESLNYISFESDTLGSGLDSVARVGIDSQFRDNRVASSPNDEEVLRLIECGIGFGPLLLTMAKELVEAGRLWRLPPYANPPRVKNFLVTNPKTPLTAAEALFVEMIEQHAAMGQ